MKSKRYCPCGENCDCIPKNSSSCNKKYHSGCFGIAYGLGFIGAAVFYIQQATGFWAGVLGVLKALVWPAMIAHKILGS